MPSSSGNSGGKTLLLWEADQHVGGMTEDKLCDFGEGGVYNFFPSGVVGERDLDFSKGEDLVIVG